MRRRQWLLVFATIALLIACVQHLGAWEAKGSIFVQAVPGLLVEDPSDGHPSDLGGQIAASSRITEAGPTAELALEALLVHDVAAATDTLYLEEASVAWKPVEIFTMRLGRQRIGFGCGFAWSVVDDLDPQPMPFDPHSPREGLDAIRFSADLAPLGAPLLISTETFAPRQVEGASLEDCGAAAQVAAFLGGMELGMAGSMQDFSADPPLSLGGWATVDVAGFVFGAEGAWRRAAVDAGAGTHTELLLNCNRRFGDFAVLAEGRWISEVDRVWLFGQLSWSRAELSASLSTLFSVRDASGLVDMSLTYAATEALEISTSVVVYEKPEALPEIGPSSYQGTLALAVEYFY